MGQVMGCENYNFAYCPQLALVPIAQNAFCWVECNPTRGPEQYDKTLL